MPRVGSSISTTRGAMLSQRASTTFCWLPPERNCTSWSRPRAETSRLDSTPGQLAPRGAGTGGQHRADDAEGVVEDRLVERQALGLAVLGDEREPATDALARAAHADGRAVECHGAAVERVHPEHRLDELGAARALEPGQADDLPRADREVDPVDVRVAGACSVSRTSPTSVPGILSG